MTILPRSRILISAPTPLATSVPPRHQNRARAARSAAARQELGAHGDSGGRPAIPEKKLMKARRRRTKEPEPPLRRRLARQFPGVQKQRRYRFMPRARRSLGLGRSPRAAPTRVANSKSHEQPRSRRVSSSERQPSVKIRALERACREYVCAPFAKFAETKVIQGLPSCPAGLPAGCNAARSPRRQCRANVGATRAPGCVTPFLYS